MIDRFNFLLVKSDLTNRRSIRFDKIENITLKIWKCAEKNKADRTIIELVGKYFEGLFIKDNLFLKINRTISDTEIKGYSLNSEPTEEYIFNKIYVDNFHMDFDEKLFVKKIEIQLEDADRRTFIDPMIIKRGNCYHVETKGEEKAIIGCISDKRDFIYLKNIDSYKDFIIITDGILKILKTKRLERRDTDLNIIFNFNDEVDNKREEAMIKQYIDNRLVFNKKIYLSLYQQRVEKNDEYVILIADRCRLCKLENNILRIGKIINWNLGGWQLEKKVYLLQVEEKKLKYIENNELVIEYKSEEASMEDIIKDTHVNTEFIQMMDKYLAFEMEILEESKTNTGKIKYKSIEKNKFNIADESKGRMESWFNKKGSFIGIASKKDKSLTIGTISEVTEDFIKVTFDSDLTKSIIPKKGILEINYMPSEIMQKRRNRAMKDIKSGSCIIADLMEILSGTKKNWGSVGHKEKLREIEKRTPNILNDKQIEAINGGLNTDNIYLIQGPPGTGKTSVIKRITGIAIKDEENVLISSFQNLAVDNVIDGLIDNDVIAYRHGSSEDSSVIDKAYRDLINRIENSLSQNISNSSEINLTDTKNKLKDFRDNFITELDIKKMKDMIYEFKNNFSENSYVPNYLVSNYLESIDSLEVAKSPKIKESLKINYPIFREFDPDFIDEILEVRDILINEERKLHDFNLKEATKILSELEENYILGDIDESSYKNEIVKIEKNIEIYNQKKIENIENAESGINIEKLISFVSIIEKILDSIPDYIEDESVNIVKEFRDTIKSTPILIEELLKKYSDVKGTTCQKVSSKGFNDVNKGNNDYNFVIIDEAARANPLDLLIPLIKGDKILLVGDHKQLPHMIENSIDDKFTNSDNAIEIYKKYVKDSLFGRLYEALPNNRKVMLDTQYRMTRKIGNLVSDLFYDGQLKTGTNIENDLNFYNKEALVVKDIKGRERRNSLGSYYNEAEANEIIEKLRELDRVSVETLKKVEVGIITFYRAQVDLISQKVKVLEFENIDVKVGTVDAYQGLEKEVIFLSTVRTQGVGFSANPNRVNVAISRAKKLLFIFADVKNMEKDYLYKKIFEQCKRSE